MNVQPVVPPTGCFFRFGGHRIRRAAGVVSPYMPLLLLDNPSVFCFAKSTLPYTGRAFSRAQIRRTSYIFD